MAKFYKVINPQNSRFNKVGKLAAKFSDLDDSRKIYRLEFEDTEFQLIPNCMFYRNELERVKGLLSK